MIKIAVCDDDCLVRKEICHLIEYLWNYPETAVFPLSPQELLSSLDDGVFDFHILVTDINMAEYNGITIGKQINSLFPSCQIIYLTGFVDYASDVYETEHCYFVLKENTHSRLPRALDKAVSLYKTNLSQYLQLNANRHIMRIPIPDILYLERNQRHCHIFTGGSTYVTNLSLKKLSQKLPASFVRCHTGYIVNLYYVKELSRNYITISHSSFEPPKQIPVGRYYWEVVKQRFLEFWGDRI